MQYQYHKAFISVLLLLVLIFPSVLLFNSPQPVQAADLGIWELRDAEWIQIGNNFTAKIFQSGFSGMKVNMISGVVICDHAGDSSGESEGIDIQPEDNRHSTGDIFRLIRYEWNL